MEYSNSKVSVESPKASSVYLVIVSFDESREPGSINFIKIPFHKSRKPRSIDFIKISLGEGGESGAINIVEVSFPESVTALWKENIIHTYGKSFKNTSWSRTDRASLFCPYFEHHQSRLGKLYSGTNNHNQFSLIKAIHEQVCSNSTILSKTSQTKRTKNGPETQSIYILQKFRRN